jgi:hypothetical protein
MTIKTPDDGSIQPSPPESLPEGVWVEGESTGIPTPTPERAPQKKSHAPVRRDSHGRFTATDGSAARKRDAEWLRETIRLQTPRDLVRVNRIIATSDDDKVVADLIKAKWAIAWPKEGVRSGGTSPPNTSTPAANADASEGPDFDEMDPVAVYQWLMKTPSASPEAFDRAQLVLNRAAEEQRRHVIEVEVTVPAPVAPAPAAPPEPPAELPAVPEPVVAVTAAGPPPPRPQPAREQICGTLPPIPPGIVGMTEEELAEVRRKLRTGGG